MPARTALVVIDMVSFFLVENAYARGGVPRIARLADVLRARGGTVAWVLPSTEGEPSAVEEEFFGSEVARLFLASGGTGPVRSRIWPAFDVAADDLVVEKTARSAFFPGRCPLPELLAGRGVDTVLITGVIRRANEFCFVSD